MKRRNIAVETQIIQQRPSVTNSSFLKAARDRSLEVKNKDFRSEDYNQRVREHTTDTV